MMRKLVVMLMAVLFSLSVSGLGFAAEEKPAAKPAEQTAPAKQPCATGEKEMKKKAAEKKAAKKKAAKKKAAKKDEGTTMAPEKAPAPTPEKK